MPKNNTPDENSSEKQPLDKTLPDSQDKPASAKSSAVESHIEATQAKRMKNAEKPSPKKAVKKAADVTEKPQQGNKLAASALTIALLSIIASGGHYFWQQQQTSILIDDIKQQNVAAIDASQKQIKQSLVAEFNQTLSQQQQTFSSQLQQLTEQLNSTSQDKIAQLSKQVAQLESRLTQRQPSDWLIHEAEYLVRVAARTMWLEQDTKAAIGLLTEADQRLGELNNPKYLPVRALIHQDIKSLELMPSLQSQQAILALMALKNQVGELSLAGVDLGESLADKENLELSNNIADWQQNLSKTWQKFLNDFITVRRRTGMVEPLMAPEQQQHLKENLTLKIQQTIWAVSEQNADIYQQSLTDIQGWLREFFDMQAVENQRFMQAVEQLKEHTIHYDFPSNLASLDAIKTLLKNNTTNKISSPATDSETTTSATEAEIQSKDDTKKLDEGIL